MKSRSLSHERHVSHNRNHSFFHFQKTRSISKLDKNKKSSSNKEKSSSNEKNPEGETSISIEEKRSCIIEVKNNVESDAINSEVASNSAAIIWQSNAFNKPSDKSRCRLATVDDLHNVVKHYSKILLNELIYHVTKVKSLKIQQFEITSKLNKLKQIISIKPTDSQSKTKNKLRQLTKNNKAWASRYSDNKKKFAKLKAAYEAIHAKKIAGELTIENLQKKIEDLSRKAAAQSIIAFDLKNVNEIISNPDKRCKKHFLASQNFSRLNLSQQNSLNRYERLRNNLILDIPKVLPHRFFSKFNSLFNKNSSKLNPLFDKNRYEITKLNEIDKQREVLEPDHGYADIK